MRRSQRPARVVARVTTYPRRRPAASPPPAPRATDGGTTGRLLLVDAATRYLTMASLAVEAGDREARTRHIDRVLRDIGALRDEITTVDDEAGRLAAVVLRHVALAATEAGVREDAEAIRRAAEPLRALRRAWAVLPGFASDAR